MENKEIKKGMYFLGICIASGAACLATKTADPLSLVVIGAFIIWVFVD